MMIICVPTRRRLWLVPPHVHALPQPWRDKCEWFLLHSVACVRAKRVSFAFYVEKKKKKIVFQGKGNKAIKGNTNNNNKNKNNAAVSKMYVTYVYNQLTNIININCFFIDSADAPPSPQELANESDPAKAASDWALRLIRDVWNVFLFYCLCLVLIHGECWLLIGVLNRAEISSIHIVSALKHTLLPVNHCNHFYFLFILIINKRLFLLERYILALRSARVALQSTRAG